MTVHSTLHCAVAAKNFATHSLHSFLYVLLNHDWDELHVGQQAEMAKEFHHSLSNTMYSKNYSIWSFPSANLHLF
jgi:hypothetical protein